MLLRLTSIAICLLLCMSACRKQEEETPVNAYAESTTGGLPTSEPIAAPEAPTDNASGAIAETQSEAQAKAMETARDAAGLAMDVAKESRPQPK